MNIRLAAQSGLADLVLSKNKWVAKSFDFARFLKPRYLQFNTTIITALENYY
jgi:hypothetical protein